jgi:subtilisin family serine protease
VEALTCGYTGDGVKVALIDTGVDYHHPDVRPAGEIQMGTRTVVLLDIGQAITVM